MNIFQISKLCYETTQVFSEIAECRKKVPWEELTEKEKAPILKIVSTVIESRAPSAFDVHNIWVKTMTDFGWTLGKVKNNELKVSPCMVGFHDLSEIEQTKDQIVLNIINAVKNLKD